MTTKDITLSVLFTQCLQMQQIIFNHLKDCRIDENTSDRAIKQIAQDIVIQLIEKVGA